MFDIINTYEKEDSVSSPRHLINREKEEKMDMKVGKATLTALVVILAASFVASTIIYGKVNETAKAGLTQIIQRQSVEVAKLTKLVLEKQKELSTVKKELGTVKNELNTVNMKSSDLIVATPKVVTK